MAGIFISYRRADSEGWAGRLSDSLKAELGRVNIFRDIEDIPPGVEFDTYITNAVSSCDVLIALIGPHWLTAANSAGQRRLDDPKDFTRLEIVGALERNIRVIPTLVGNAELPSADDLPEDIRPLVRRQTYELSDARWADDCRRLAAVLRPIVKRESWLTKKIAAGLLAAAVAIGGGGVWHWYDQQSERARIAAETQRQAEELRIAQEKQAQDKIIREKKEKEEAEDRLAREEAERQAAAKKDAKAKQDALNAAAAKRDAVNRAQNALAASSRMVSRIALLVRQGSDFAKRAEIAAISAGRYRAPNQAILETIRRAREAGAKASSAYRELKDTEPDANQQLTAVKEFAAAAEQTADNAAAARASESATRAAEKIKYVSSLAEQKLQIARDLAQAAEAALEEVKAALGDDGTSDALSITSITPPTSTTLRARAPQVLTVYLRSTLASTDRAILAVFLEQYPESAGGCVGATHRTSDGTNISIERGTRNLKASVRSPGGSAGFYLGVGVNLWSDSGGRPGKRIRAFGVFPQYCFRVLP